MSAQANLKVSLEAWIDATIDIGVVRHDILYGAQHVLSPGTGADQINQIFSDTRTIAASGTDDLDLAGVLVNALGAVCTFTKIRAIMVKAASGNTNNVVIGGAAATQFFGFLGAATHTVNVRPGGFFCIAANDATGYAVTATTADLLRVANSGAGTGVTYDIVILGA